jgi:hypothetical protein
MRGSESDGEGVWRESAAFNVTIEDYRAAFAAALATDTTPLPPFGRTMRAAAFRAWWAGSGAAAVGGLFLVWPAIRGGEVFYEAGMALHMLAIAGVGALVVVPLALFAGVMDARHKRGWRGNFARDHTQWKVPTRLRIRWNDKSLMLVGSAGFGSFAWGGLYGWLDRADRLILFTAMLDPVPVPHAALAPGDLDSLRALLTAAEVPADWQANRGGTQHLQRVFR